MYQEPRRLGCQLRYKSCCHVPTATTCGRPPAAVPVGTVTHNNVTHTPRLSLAIGNSWDMLILASNPSRDYVTADMVLYAVVLQVYCMKFCLFISSMAPPCLRCSAGCHSSMEPGWALESVSRSISTSSTRHCSCCNYLLKYVKDSQKADAPFAPSVAI